MSEPWAYPNIKHNPDGTKTIMAGFAFPTTVPATLKDGHLRSIELTPDEADGLATKLLDAITRSHR